MAVSAVTKVGVTHETVGMADAVVLLAVIPLAVAAFAHSLSQGSLLLFSCQYGGWTIVIQATVALTNSWYARKALLEADAIKLAAVTSFAVASLATRRALTANLVKLFADSLSKAL